MRFVRSVYFAPPGEMVLVASPAAIVSARWVGWGRPAEIELQAEDGKNEIISRAVSALDRYFGGDCGALVGFPVEYAFGTAFQREVWNALLNVPCGEVVSYSRLAAMLGRPTAVRAVANAVGANPLPVFLPCHRIVRNDGSLGGYTGPDGAKQFLLDLERR